MSPEQQFERELELFRTECESAAQFFYAYLAVHKVAKEHRRVFRLLNQNALFWNTVLAGLQTSALIVIGRIFDQSSPHNVDKVLQIAQRNLGIFSSEGLGRRKQGDQQKPPDWLDDFLSDCYVPTGRDFRQLRQHISKHRKIYESAYRDLRNKVFAHKVVSEPLEVAALVSKTNIGELKRMLVFLVKLYATLWELFMNGRKPVLRPMSRGVHKDIASEAKSVLLKASRAIRAPASAVQVARLQRFLQTRRSSLR